MVQRAQLFYNESIKSLTYKGRQWGSIFLRVTSQADMIACPFGEDMPLFIGHCCFVL